MKKVFCALVSFLMLFSSVSAYAIDETSALTQVSLNDIVSNNYASDSVAFLENSDFSNINSFEPIKSYVDYGGILVLNYQDSKFVNDELKIPFEIIELDCSSEEVLTFYYKFGDGVSGVYILNCQNTTDDEKKHMVDEVLYIICARQEESLNNSVSTASTLSTTTEKILEKIDYTSTYQPRGKLNLSYEFYTVQDYVSRDYYIVKGSINGMPGCILANSDSSYESKYQGKAMTASIATTSSSVTVDSYGPHRSVNTSSYSVNVGGTFKKGTSPAFNAGFSYTRNLEDTDIEASATTTEAEWEIDFDGNAQEKSFNFEPAVTFDCPSTKSSVDFLLSASYDVDAWNTFNHTISASLSVRCNASNAVAI